MRKRLSREGNASSVCTFGVWPTHTIYHESTFVNKWRIVMIYILFYSSPQSTYPPENKKIVQFTLWFPSYWLYSISSASKKLHCYLLFLGLMHK
uniref:Uncharacterized protein n=1 Tax=Anguilla anguilla TaxID=7936 RepID=A0A0E9XD14_ANGAN